MSLRRFVGLVSALAVGGMAVQCTGCSSSETFQGADATSFGPGAPDSGTHLRADPTVADSGPSSRDAASPVRDATSLAVDSSEEAALLACPPANTASYVPPTYVAAIAQPGACSPADIATFIAACADAPDSGSSCADWQSANAAVDGGIGTACGNCIFAPGNNGAAWVDPWGIVDPNYAACIQLTDSIHGTACATAYNNYGACNAVACDYCSTPDAPTGVDDVNDVSACLGAALVGGCNSFDAQLDACDSDFELDGGAFFRCAPSVAQADDAGVVQDWTYIARLMCGETSVDAGAD